jgi:Zn-dependent peptidase ImmA (M78 family)
MIFGSRVRQAREVRALTQTQLATACGVAQPYVAAVESGAKPASDSFVRRTADVTGFPLDFFTEPATDLGPGSLLFRAKASMTSRQERQARRYGELLFEAMQMLMSDLRPIPVQVPHLTADALTAERAARVVRSAWGYAPDEPLDNLLLRAERNGVFAAAAPLAPSAHEAFSTWAGQAPDVRPLLVLFSCAAPDRVRFNVAHEIGHLVLHQAYRDRPRVIEAEANAFASALLLPEMAMRRELRAPITLTRLLELKIRWGVSMQALARRAWQLGIVSESQYRRLCIQISSRGWRTAEPGAEHIPLERPRTLGKMAEVLYGTPVDHLALARRLRWEPLLVRELLAQQASIGDLTGGGSDDADAVVHQLRPAQHGPS